jgi:hypothetical protein
MMRPLLVAIALLAALTAPAPADTSPAWKAGVGRVKITPAQSMWMSGYSGRTRPAEGTEHDLWAKALALEDAAGRRAVVITTDLVGVPRELSVAVCAALAEKHGLKRDAVLLSTSHTHCGPVVGSNLGAMYFLDAEQQRRVAEYEAFLRNKLVEVVGQALASLAPAEVAWGNGYTTFAVNRRTNKEAAVPELRERGRLKGPVDHDVPVLSVRDPAGRLRAVLFGYACHATVMDYYKWSGDYPGFAQIALEKRHPGAVALFWAGCGADQNPLPRRQVSLAERYGQVLAEAVEAVLAAPMNRVDRTLATSYAEVALPFDDLPTREQLLKDSENSNRYVASRARLLLKRIRTEGSLKGTYPYPVQAWRLGPELTLVALGGEVVVDYALRLKRELGPRTTWVAGYCNDVMAYIPSLRVLKEGGYEGGGAMLYYGQPTVWGPRVEDVVVGAAHEQVKKVRR